jgi:hypothetical protein
MPTLKRSSVPLLYLSHHYRKHGVIETSLGVSINLHDVIDIRRRNAMYKHAIAALAIAATGVLLSAGPVAADPWDDWSEEGCTTYTLRPGWAPNWPVLDTLGVRKLIENASGTARVCTGPNARRVLERYGLTEAPVR